MKRVIAKSRQTLAKNAKSFRWASWFLPSECRDDAAVVYALCRLIDDTVDDATSPESAREEIGLLREELLQTRKSRPLVQAFLEVADRKQMQVAYASALIDGVSSDIGPVRIQTEEELYRYCYRVAGTVGLMMCSVLGITDRRARAHAIDLGVAMQLTNICRDVREDAETDRVYLPSASLDAVGICQQTLVDGDVDRTKLAEFVSESVHDAERYYASAEDGMRYIPRRSRLAILIAAGLYREIGRKLVNQHGGDAMRGRTYLTPMRKLVLVLATISRFLNPLSKFVEVGHDATLHLPLSGMPDTNCSS